MNRPALTQPNIRLSASRPSPTNIVVRGKIMLWQQKVKYLGIIFEPKVTFGKDFNEDVSKFLHLLWFFYCPGKARLVGKSKYWSWHRLSDRLSYIAPWPGPVPVLLTKSDSTSCRTWLRAWLSQHHGDYVSNVQIHRDLNMLTLTGYARRSGTLVRTARSVNLHDIGELDPNRPSPRVRSRCVLGLAL